MEKLYKVLGIGLVFVLSAFTTVKASLLPTPLQWDPSPDSSVAGYAVYYTSSNPRTIDRVDAGKTLTATIPLTVGSTYSIFVVAYDVDGVESLPSNVRSYTPPPMTRLKLARMADNTMRIQFRSALGKVCVVQGTPRLNAPQWQTVGIGTADANGYIVVNDPPAGRPPVRFYRARQL